MPKTWTEDDALYWYRPAKGGGRERKSKSGNVSHIEDVGWEMEPGTKTEGQIKQGLGFSEGKDAPAGETLEQKRARSRAVLAGKGGAASKPKPKPTPAPTEETVGGKVEGVEEGVKGAVEGKKSTSAGRAAFGNRIA